MEKNCERLTLYELNSILREVIETAMPSEYWVEAELSECRENRGHCYMELIQKDERGYTPIAKASAKCWASKWSVIRPYFERVTGQRLSAGMSILLKVYPQFHEAYGFSWIVSDIDPTYTLGDMARKRQDIIRRLKEEGVYELQKELILPHFCQRIAVISSQTAAGYGDFCNQLAENPYGFRFQTRLFPVIMQGEGIEHSIINALEQIYNLPFDCVVIIRGGGATSDMAGFDTLALAEHVANFPLPVITGIGHDRDECILDLISHTRVKTPTAAATFLISHLKQVLDTVDNAQERITRYMQQKLSMLNTQLSVYTEMIPKIFAAVNVRQLSRIDLLSQRMVAAVQHRVLAENGRLSTIELNLPIHTERRLQSEYHRLQIAEEKLKSLDPMLLLKRGYSITLKNGRAVHDVASLEPGDQIETRLEKGCVKSIVTSS